MGPALSLIFPPPPEIKMIDPYSFYPVYETKHEHRRDDEIENWFEPNDYIKEVLKRKNIK